MLLVRNDFGQSGRCDVRQPAEDCLAPDTGDLTVSIEVRLRATVLNAAFADNLVNRPRLLGGETTAPRARGGAACQCEMQPLADWDRGTPRDATPPSPPGIRVRTTAVRLG